MLNGESWREKIATLILDRPRLVPDGSQCPELGRPEAALTIVNDLYRMLENAGSPEKRAEGRNTLGGKIIDDPHMAIIQR